MLLYMAVALFVSYWNMANLILQMWHMDQAQNLLFTVEANKVYAN